MEVEKFRKAIEVLQAHETEETALTAIMLRVFLLVATEPALSQKDMQQRLGIAHGNIARLCAALGSGSPRKKGLGWIVGRQNPFDYRSQQYFLTHKGLILVAQIVEILREG